MQFYLRTGFSSPNHACLILICTCAMPIPVFVPPWLSFLLQNFDHLFVSGSIRFSSNSKLDVHFHCTSYSYSSAGWDGFGNHLRDVTWGYDLNNFYCLGRTFQEAPSYSSNSTGFKKKGNKKGFDKTSQPCSFIYCRMITFFRL